MASQDKQCTVNLRVPDKNSMFRFCLSESGVSEDKRPLGIQDTAKYVGNIYSVDSRHKQKSDENGSYIKMLLRGLFFKLQITLEIHWYQSWQLTNLPLYRTHISRFYGLDTECRHSDYT